MITRNGLQAFVKLCHRICTLLGRWQASIVVAVNSSGLSTEQKAEVIATITAINAACGALIILTTKYEL